MKYTFKGGIHVNDHKHTARCQVKLFSDPKKVVIPMSQHIGAPCVCLVKKGDKVFAGQKIGKVPEGALGAPVHSSVSGTVEKVEKVADGRGAFVECVTIANDFQNELDSSVKVFSKKLSDATIEEIIEIVREAGVVGMGGAGFPTHVKISSAIGKASTIIINCAECEPYLTANYRLMIERPHEIINGAKILMKALGVRNVIIAIEDNKPAAIRKMKKLIEGNETMRVVELKTKYPQGDERRLIYALTKKELPVGKLPADLGCVILNAESLSAIFTAFAKGLPSIYRIVTVDGDCIAEPSNVLVPVGTTVEELVDFCGGLINLPAKIISGGPMMGVALWSPQLPVTKTTSGILVFSERRAPEKVKDDACIRCGKCLRNCPSNLMPLNIVANIKTGNIEGAKDYGVMNCVECGCCSYGCPAGIPLVQYIKMAKSEIRKAVKK